MDTSTYISHRMFVAAVSGGRRTQGPTPSAPVPVFGESAPPAAAAPPDQKRRREALGALAFRQALSFGASDGC